MRADPGLSGPKFEIVIAGRPSYQAQDVSPSHTYKVRATRSVKSHREWFGVLMGTTEHGAGLTSCI